jgi:hypothetical protein
MSSTTLFFLLPIKAAFPFSPLRGEAPGRPEDEIVIWINSNCSLIKLSSGCKGVHWGAIPILNSTVERRFENKF